MHPKAGQTWEITGQFCVTGQEAAGTDIARSDIYPGVCSTNWIAPGRRSSDLPAVPGGEDRAYAPRGSGRWSGIELNSFVRYTGSARLA
jgi:hypothetical protein